MRKLSLKSLSCGLFWVVLSTPAPAFAANELAIHFSADFTAERGLYATGSTKNLLQVEIGYAHTVKTFRRGALWLEGSFTIGERHDRVFSALDTGLLVEQLTVGARYTIPIRHWVVPQLRIGAGAVIGTLSLHGLAYGAESSSSAGFTGYALGGIQFLLPRPWMNSTGSRGVTAGLVIEGGYQYATNLHFSSQPAPSSTTLQMTTVSTDLGTLALRGALFRLGALLLF